MAAPTITTGVLTGGSNNHATSSEEANGLATDFVSQGIVGAFTNTSGVAPATGAFAVNAQGTPDTTVAISTGVAYVSATPTSQNSQALRIKCTVTGNLTISANASGSTKYDWIYISISAANSANPNSAADNVATIVASRSSSASTDDGTPPTYGYAIAVVTVANGFSSITNGNIRDVRANSIVNQTSSSVSSGWLASGYTPNTVTALGNRSYSMVFNSVNLTTTLSAGMRLKISRLVTAPTQCTSLNGTTQYYSKTSPTGYTFTDSFTYSAWVKPTSYALGTIIGRFSTTGSMLQMNASGQLLISAKDAGTTDSALTSQSLPLNKWSHVAMTMIISSNTVTAYIDGVAVPTAYTNGTTTAVTQAGNLEIGGNNGGTNPFPGKIAQAAVYNAVLSGATILAAQAQTLSGSETSLISAYTFNGVITDSNANANNLTANGSAVATNADSPFGLQADGTTAGTTEYAIITKTAFSTNTTLTVQVPEGNAIPTTGGVSAVSYSTQKVPYNFPSQREKWVVGFISKIDNEQASPVSGTWYNPGSGQLNIPIGAWRIYYESTAYGFKTTATSWQINNTLSTANNSESDPEFTAVQIIEGASGTLDITVTLHREKYLSLTAATPYYLNIKSTTASGSTIGIRGDITPTLIYAELTLL